MNYTGLRIIVLSAALITVTLMVYMARPWGDNYAYQSLSGYILLLGFAVWATLPYFATLFLARKAVEANANFIMVVIGSFLISFGGLALYVIATFIERDPQGGLVFLAVPCYQWIILGGLTAAYFLFRK
jgi:hypothetical protein